MKRFRLSRKTYRITLACACAGIIILLGLFMYLFALRAPSGFPANTVISVESGQSLTTVASMLEKDNVIRSPFWFTNFVIMLKHERGVVGGTYYFEKPLNVYEVALRLARGRYNMEQLKTTIPEGSTIFDISQIIKKHYPAFDDVHFFTLARGKEGYLFPDTYLFGATVDPKAVLDKMLATFNKKIALPEVSGPIQTFGKPLNDVITMASILEGEARQLETRRMVAGILWKRIDMGIPLQVDAAFRYVNGKTTEQLTAADLKIDNPYNTYVYKGLTPTPISNPGLDSILAAVTPIKSDYLYFLTDSQGNMHYAKTLEEHAANKKKYLK